MALRNPTGLLHFDGRALLLELGLHGSGLVLVDARLHNARRAIDKILCFLQTQTGQLAHDLDDLDLLRAGFLQTDRELGLLFGCRCRGRATTARCGRSADWSGGNGDVELALESLD